MHRSFLLTPFLYFASTRLNDKKSIVYHGFSEFVLGILILLFFTGDVINSIFNFSLGYLAFISIYEIGYFINDFISVRFEKNPRNRLNKWSISSWFIVWFIAIRIASFSLITILLVDIINIQWVFFYLLLVISFALHNMIKTPEKKVLTFISLATIRFYAPIFPFLTMESIQTTVPATLLYYVLYRTLTYMDSKELLKIPNRDTVEFKLHYYLVLLPVAGILYALTGSLFSLSINIYFLLFWGVLFFLNKRFELFQRHPQPPASHYIQ